MKQLLVVEPGVQLNGDAYKRLADAGYVVIRGNPSQFHLLGGIPDTQQTGIVLDAALAVLRLNWNFAGGKDVRDRFATELLNRLPASK